MGLHGRPSGGLAVAAGGGGSKAAFTAGYLDVLNRAAIPVRTFYGASGGAVVAGAFAARWGDPTVGDDVLEHLRSFASTSPLRLLLDMQRRLKQVLQAELGDRRLEDAASFRVPTVISVTNLWTLKGESIRSGRAAQVILASAAHPGMKPIQLDGLRDWYGDGAVTDYLALGGFLETRSRVRSLIVIDLSDPPRMPDRKQPNVWEASKRMFQAAVEAHARDTLARIPPEVTVLHVKPDLPARSVTDFRRAEADFALGQRYASLTLNRHLSGRKLSEGGYLTSLPLEYQVERTEPGGSRSPHSLSLRAISPAAARARLRRLPPAAPAPDHGIEHG
jgi:predicted acylesterase/phospholipase RssA